MTKEQKEFLTTSEIATILGVSRIAVFKKIKSGKIKAKKYGRNYLIRREDLPAILGKEISAEEKEDIGEAVDKVLDEYGTTLKLLAKE